MVRIPAAISAAVSLSALLLGATLIAQTGDQAALSAAPAATPGASKVRIVRLSQVKGQVHMDHQAGRGLETAIANLPIVEKSRLQTGLGVAEVEFEDNSTLRLAPNSAVEFTQLERLPGGTTVSSVSLLQGMAYVSLMKTPGNEFNLHFGQQNLRLPGASHIRLQLDDQQATLAVFDGDVHVESPMGLVDVPHKRTATFRNGDSSQPAVAKDIESNTFDPWDHNAAEYHARTAAMSAFGNSPYAYGLSDLGYYGSFANAGGCGSMWRPYFASADWSPYSNGVWAYYEGAGYSWVSPYPWGWTPYHSGSWTYCQGTGWGWMPGNSWMGLNNIAAVSAPNLPGRGPQVPSRAPGKGEPTLTPVNLKPIVHSEISAANAFIFRKDSAGLGVPRDGGLGKLSEFSQHTIQKGIVSTPVHIETPSARSGSQGSHEAFGVGQIRRGSMPSSTGESAAQMGGANPGGRSSGATPVVHAPAGGHH